MPSIFTRTQYNVSEHALRTCASFCIWTLAWLVESFMGEYLHCCMDASRLGKCYIASLDSGTMLCRIGKQEMLLTDGVEGDA
jgi:hypothetical protein